jgi:hypothetical protein
MPSRHPISATPIERRATPHQPASNFPHIREVYQLTPEKTRQRRNILNIRCFDRNLRDAPTPNHP